MGFSQGALRAGAALPSAAAAGHGAEEIPVLQLPLLQGGKSQGHAVDDWTFDEFRHVHSDQLRSTKRILGEARSLHAYAARRLSACFLGWARPAFPAFRASSSRGTSRPFYISSGRAGR